MLAVPVGQAEDVGGCAEDAEQENGAGESANQERSLGDPDAVRAKFAVA